MTIQELYHNNGVKKIVLPISIMTAFGHTLSEGEIIDINEEFYKIEKVSLNTFTSTKLNIISRKWYQLKRWGHTLLN